MSSAIRFCANHPTTHALALCMSCHKHVCHECATRWDGINYCASCLAAKRGTRAERSSAAGWISVLLGIAVMLVATTSLIVTLGVWIAEAM